MMTQPLFDVTGAKSKRPTEEDHAVFEPMAAATRGSSGPIRRNPSTDQKKVRRQQRKQAAIENSDMIPAARATARTNEQIAELGRQHHIAGDHTKYGLGNGWYYMSAELPDGVSWTLYDGTHLMRANGKTDTFANAKSAATEAFNVATGTKEASVIHQSGDHEQRHELSDGWYIMVSKSMTHFFWTLYNTRGVANGSGFGDTLDRIMESAESVKADVQEHSRRRQRQRGASTVTTQSNYERRDGLRLTAGDVVHKLGDPERYTFVTYDTVTDRAVIADTVNRKFTVSPDVLIIDDEISATARLSPVHQGSIHEAILGHLGGDH